MKIAEWQKRLEDKQDRLLEEFHSLKTELAVHKVKSGFWGALMGAISTVMIHFGMRGGS